MLDCLINDFNFIVIYQILRVCALLLRSRARALKNNPYTLMDGVIELFDKFGYAVALSITLLIFAYRFVKQYIKYLQDTVKDLASIIAKNTELYKLLYDYLTKT